MTAMIRADTAMPCLILFLQKWISEARLVMIDNAGHMTQGKKPEELVAAVMEK